MPAWDDGSREDAPPEATRFTVLGLFDDVIDAEQVLVALRRAERPAEHVSVLVRDRAAEAGASDRHGEVGRAVVANALNAVSGWLLGLAALIIPDNGAYLVAGPIGAALTGFGSADDQRRAGDGDAETAGEPGSGENGVRQTLTGFGFRSDEAVYIHQRLAAGSLVVAVTTADPDQLQAIRRMFADQSAVHIGQAQTGESVAHQAEELLATAPERVDAGNVVVADAVAPLRHGFGDEPGASQFPGRGRPVIDAAGEDAGTVEDILLDGSAPDAPVLRYVIVGFGGVLGLGRHRVAVPAEQIDLSLDPARLLITKEILRRAPAYSAEMPFSRREEMAINAYFGSMPYWIQ